MIKSFADLMKDSLDQPHAAKFVILLVLLAGGACLADPRYASLKITSQPDSAVVVLDGLLQGRAPVEIPMIAPGKHQLLVFKRGCKRYDRSVTCECGKRTVGRIKLDSLPADERPADGMQGDMPAKDDTTGIARKPFLLRKPRLNFTDSYIQTSSGAYAWFDLLVDESGKVLAMEKLSSSGDEVFDRDAVTAIRKWKFQPALRTDGRPCMMWVTYRYSLMVTEDLRRD